MAPFADGGGPTEVMRVIETAYPEKHWDKLEMTLPDWKDIGESSAMSR